MSGRIGIQPLLDSRFPTHGNWKGLNHVRMPVVTQVLLGNSADGRCGGW